jgi:hypothetical protein
MSSGVETSLIILEGENSKRFLEYARNDIKRTVGNARLANANFHGFDNE